MSTGTGLASITRIEQIVSPLTTSLSRYDASTVSQIRESASRVGADYRFFHRLLPAIGFKIISTLVVKNVRTQTKDAR